MERCDASIEEEDMEIIKLLLANGCAVTDTNSQGRIPLDEFELAVESYGMSKSCEGYDEVVKLL